MTQITTQSEVDYIQSAQYRVASDTRVLKKKAPLTLLAGATSLTLPAEVIRLEGLFNGSDPVVPVRVVEYLQTVSASVAGWSGDLMIFAVIGRSVYLHPTPSADLTLTAYYSYRPAAITSASSLELSGQAERLVERLAGAYLLVDDGQPELGQEELAAYYKDAGRLRHQTRRSEGMGGRISLSGRRQR